MSLVRKSVFVTVGTTKFDRLVETVDSNADILKRLHYTHITYQIGDGNCWPASSQLITDCFRFKDSLRENYRDADLIISHAGAGTCLEVLKLEKPLLVVINDSLMDNHQLELAEQLAKMQHLSYCYCDNFRDALLTFDDRNLKPLKSDSLKKFVRFLDNDVLNFYS